MTLRDYMNIVEGEKKSPFRHEYDEQDKDSILEHFTLMDLRR